MSLAECNAHRGNISLKQALKQKNLIVHVGHTCSNSCSNCYLKSYFTAYDNGITFDSRRITTLKSLIKVTKSKPFQCVSILMNNNSNDFKKHMRDIVALKLATQINAKTYEVVTADRDHMLDPFLQTITGIHNIMHVISITSVKKTLEIIQTTDQTYMEFIYRLNSATSEDLIQILDELKQRKIKSRITLVQDRTVHEERTTMVVS